MVHITALCGILALSLLPCRGVSADSESLSAKVANRIKSVSKEKMPAVVRIRCNDGQGEVNGTGFRIDPTGTICTSAEIVRGARDISVL